MIRADILLILIRAIELNKKQLTNPNLGEIEETSETFIVQIIITLFVCLFIYMLYINGFLLFNMKIADFFIGYIKRDGSVSLN